MKNVFSHTKPISLAILFIAFVIGSSWQLSPKSKAQSKSVSSDTTKPGQHSPGKVEPGVKDIDQAMKELEEAMRKLEVEMKKTDFSKIEQELKEAMSKVDFKKLSEEIKASMEKVDWKKLQLEAEQSMINADVEMKKVDFNKIELQMQQLQDELKEKQLNIKVDSEKIRQQVDESMRKAKVEIEKVREEMKFMKEFTSALEADGLISKKKGYRVQVKDGDLFINGTRQSKEVSDKYRKYFKKDNFTISTDGEDRITL